ncbi:MAG: OmpH family outer membrane protein, partial [Rickettsia conorii subsp. raoultii]
MIYRVLCLCIFIINFSTITEAQNVPIKEDNFKVRVAVADVQSILEGSIAIKDLR